MPDQAERLRELVRHWELRRKQTRRTIAVASGKGGVGKTNLTVNLALALKEEGRSVTLLDADLGLANVDVVLGIPTTYTLAHVTRQEKKLAEIVYSAHGLQLIAGGRGVEELLELSDSALRNLVQEAARLDSDFFLIDTSAGISQSVTSLALAAGEVLIVTTPEPTALTDAYALVKVLLRRNPALRLHLVVNRVRSPREGTQVMNNLQQVVQQFLGASLNFLGYIPEDNTVRSAVLKQEPLLHFAPQSLASRQVRAIAGRLIGESSINSVGGFSAFISRLRFLLH